MKPLNLRPSHRVNRRELLGLTAAAALAGIVRRVASQTTQPGGEWTETTARDWLSRWQANIVADSKHRYCDSEMGEELGWLVSPFLNGFYFGYLAARDTVWLDRLVDWSDAWARRGVMEPDGYLGWPKDDGASTEVVPGLHTDNMLGEAMALKPMVMLTNIVRKTPELKTRYAEPARRYLELAEKTFAKWDSRGCWRVTNTGGVWIVPEFGIDAKTGGWTDGYPHRATAGFSHPANKQNAIAQWLLALADVTGKPIYRERASLWFAAMKSRMRLRDGKYLEWNYWDAAGPWDLKPDGSPRHWVGVHPNGGYYGIDVEAIADAFSHGLVFEQADMDRLIVTNRDFMWNQKISGARFRRIDGGPSDPRWPDSPGVLWTGLLRYDTTLRRIFVANHKPDDWSGMALSPRFVVGQ